MSSQPFFSEGSEAMNALEAMVDTAGIRNVAFALSQICGAKAEHIQTNWHDAGLAKLWNANANKFEACGLSLKSGT